MRILFVLPYIPNLIRVRSFNFIRALAARGHSVSLFAVDDGSADEDDLSAAAEICDRIETVPLTKQRAGWNMLTAVPSSLPLQAAYAWHPKAVSSPRPGSILADLGKFDLIHVEHMRASRYGLAMKAMLFGQGHFIPVVYDSVDCLSVLFRLTARHALHPLNRLVALFEIKRNERYESFLLGQYDRVLVTSNAERSAFISLRDGKDIAAEISVVPNGVDLDYFRPDLQPTKDADTIIMTGKMSYHANIAMCRYFIEEILPQIWRSRPDVRLLVVGKDPPVSLRAYAQDDRIRVTGMVPDLRPYFQQASAAVAPLVYGTGIQNKVLEAMASGLPVVATSQAAAALGVQNGRELFIADQPSEFAERVIELLADPDLRMHFSATGREFVERHHDWNRVASQLEEIYFDVINDQRI